jgi:ABC-type multidrug transport system fused ATPase/permease subunit
MNNKAWHKNAMSDVKKFNWTQIGKALWPYVRPYRAIILLSILLSSISIGIDLLEPIIYKRVLNDLSGVFVHMAESPGPDASEDEIFVHLKRTQETHGKGKVSPRTVDQAFHSLLLAAAALLVVNIFSHGFSLFSDFLSNRYSSFLEQDFIESLYGHVLKMKLSFLSTKSSAALSKQIDQTDQVGPAVSTIVQESSGQIFRLPTFTSRSSSTSDTSTIRTAPLLFS